MELVAYQERPRLEELDEWIERWITHMQEEAAAIAGKIDPEQVQLIVRTTRRLAHRLDDSLPPSFDPTALAEIRGIILGGIRKLEEEDEKSEARPLVRISGVGFFDYLHGQRGVAPNGIELHPVLSVEFP